MIIYAQKLDFPLPYLPFKEDTTTLYKKYSQDTKRIYTKAGTTVQEVILDSASRNVWAYVYKKSVLCKVELHKDFIFDMKPAQVLAVYVDTALYRKVDTEFKQKDRISLAETMVIRSSFEEIYSYAFGFAVGANGLPSHLCFQVFNLVVDKKYDSLSKMLNSFKPVLRFSGYFGLKMANNYGYVPSELVKKQLLDFEKENILIPYRYGCDGEYMTPLQTIMASNIYPYYQSMKLAELEKLVEEVKKFYIED